MADLATQSASPTGTTLTMAAASGGGDSFTPGSSTVVIVRNLDASSKTVTVVRPGTTYGTADPDIAVVVPATSVAVLGPYPSDMANPSTGRIDLTYSATTSLTLAPVKFV